MSAAGPIHLYFDVDSMERAVLVALKARGVGVTTALETEMTEATDEEQLQFALSQGWVLFTFNIGHFCKLHAEYLSQGRSHAGIVVAPQRRFSVGERVRRLLALVAARTAEEMQNRLEYLSDWPADDGAGRLQHIVD